jgi:hypothetical protein
MSTSIQPNKGGYRWIRSTANAGLGTPPMQQKVIATAYGTSIFNGDGCAATTDGSIVVCGAGTAVKYVFQGMKQFMSAGFKQRGAYYPSGTAYTGTTDVTNPLASIALVIQVDGQLFEMDVNGAQSTKTAANTLIQATPYANIVATAGSTVSGQSNFVVDNTTWSASATGLVVQLVEIPTYGLGGTAMNDPTTVRWRGIFKFVNIPVL